LKKKEEIFPREGNVKSTAARGWKGRPTPRAHFTKKQVRCSSFAEKSCRDFEEERKSYGGGLPFTRTMATADKVHFELSALIGGKLWGEENTVSLMIRGRNPPLALKFL